MNTETDPLYVLCRRFMEKHKISCPEASCEDRVYINAPELVEDIGKIVGFYRYPDEVKTREELIEEARKIDPNIGPDGSSLITGYPLY